MISFPRLEQFQATLEFIYHTLQSAKVGFKQKLIHPISRVSFHATHEGINLRKDIISLILHSGHDRAGNLTSRLNQLFKAGTKGGVVCTNQQNLLIFHPIWISGTLLPSTQSLNSSQELLAC